MIFYKAGYKYQLVEDYKVTVSAPFAMIPGFIKLENQILTIRAGYAWDGPSGPSWDSKTFMRGSLVHDALYQLMREGMIDIGFRPFVDDLLRQHCREDGMNWFRAWYVHKALRLFGKKAALPKSKKPIITAP